MKKKECGDCTLCCMVLPIHQVQSPPSVMCQHCTIESKCNIYDTRPEACKNFNCEWILDETMSDDLRPDKTGVIFEKITNTIYLSLVNYTNLNAWDNAIVRKHIKKLNDSGSSVIISSFTNQPKLFLLADGKTQEEVIEESMKIYNKEFGK